MILGCTDGEFECLAGGCIDSASVCDGWDDCPSGSDETAFLCVDLGTTVAPGNVYNQTLFYFSIFEAIWNYGNMINKKQFFFSQSKVVLLYGLTLVELLLEGQG